jgi:CHAT domain-containing protein
LGERLAALQSELNAVYNAFLDPQSMAGHAGLPEAGQAGTLDLPALRRRAAAIETETEIGRLQLRPAREAPDHDPFGEAFSFDNWQARGAGKIPLLAYFLIGDEIAAFILSGDEVTAVRNLGSKSRVQALLNRLEAQWSHFRAGRNFTDRHMPVLLQSTRRILVGLHRELIAPLADHLSALQSSQTPPGGPCRLVIAPHGPLHHVPFHALFDGSDYLLDRFAISYTLSAAVQTRLQARDRRIPRAALIAGLADENIPTVEDEVRSVDETLAEAGIERQLWTGAKAARQAFYDSAPGADLLHLACHGLFRPDNPMFSALKFADGWLNAAEVLGMSLPGSVAALSACESGRAWVLSGEEVIGLPRAFLGAGATCVLVSLWLAADESAGEMMQRWYRGWLDGSDRADALRRAQIEIRERFPHPFYWAPFVLIGKR